MTITLTFAQGDEIKVHAAGCADLSKAPAKRAAYNGTHNQRFPDGTDERDVWIDFNEDFLHEAADMYPDENPANAAWPLVFLPCCAKAGLVPNSDRTWSKPE